MRQVRFDNSYHVGQVILGGSFHDIKNSLGSFLIAPPRTCYSTTPLQNQPHLQELELLLLVEYGLLENLMQGFFSNYY